MLKINKMFQLHVLFLWIICGAIFDANCAPSHVQRISNRVPFSNYGAINIEDPTHLTKNPVPTPFRYSFSAGRSPGGLPDRYVEQEGDKHGIVKGSYSYLDPNWKWQQVKYIADPKTGFNVIDTDPTAVHLDDTPAVAQAKLRHTELFQTIAAGLQDERNVGAGQTPAVSAKSKEHSELFKRISAEHERIAAEHKKMAALNKGAVF